MLCTTRDTVLIMSRIFGSRSHSCRSTRSFLRSCSAAGLRSDVLLRMYSRVKYPRCCSCSHSKRQRAPLVWSDRATDGALLGTSMRRRLLLSVRCSSILFPQLFHGYTF